MSGLRWWRSRYAPDTVVNELLDCGECASELEVVSLDPPRLEEAPEVAEDWGE